MLGVRHFNDAAYFDPIRSEEIFEEHSVEERRRPQNHAETDDHERFPLWKRWDRPGSSYSSGNYLILFHQKK